eukprot:gene10122-18785_t
MSQTWTEIGYSNMHSFLSDCKKHVKAKTHLEAYKTWKTFNVTERIDAVFLRARREEIATTKKSNRTGRC